MAIQSAPIGAVINQGNGPQTVTGHNPDGTPQFSFAAGPTKNQQAANSNPTPQTAPTDANGNPISGAFIGGKFVATPSTTPAPANSGSSAPTVADVYGSGTFNDQLSAADAAKTAAYDPSTVAANDSQTRADVLKSYQSQIDALDQAAAEARARITTQFAPIAAGRVGSATASESRRGLLGSDFGNAQTDTVNQQNTNDLNNQIAASDAQFANQKQALMQFITGEADKEIAIRNDASQKGADAKIAEIQDRQARAQASALNSVKAMIAAGVVDPSNPNFNDTLQKIATNTNLPLDYVTGLFTDTKNTADAAALKAQNDAAALAKTKAETGAVLTPDQVAAEEASKLAVNKSTITKNNAAAAASISSLPTSGSITNGNLPQVNMTADNRPDTAAQAAFLNSIPDSNLKALIQGIADYKINPNSLPTRNYRGVGGLTQSQVLSLVSQYDPTFSQSQYASRQALQTQFTSGKYSQNINALNTAVGHIADILSNTKNLGNGSMPLLNAGKNAIASFFGAGGPGKASINIKAATSELANVFKGSGATDDEIKALGTVDANSSPNQVNQYIEGATQLLASRLQALTDTYTAGMGKAPATSFLSPTSQATLQNLQKAGLNIDVPGINNAATSSVQDQATAAGYDYNAMKAAGYTDEQINAAINGQTQ